VRKDTLSLYQDLEFLLTPQPIESMERTIRQDIGQEFTYMRQSKNLTVRQMSRQVGISVDCLITIENGKSSAARVTSFQWYYKYAGFFEVTIRDLFQRIVQPEAEEKRNQLLKKKRILDEDEIIKRIHEVMRRINESEEQVTLKAISEAIHVSLSRLYKYPRIKTLLEEIEEHIQTTHRDQRIKREDEMMEKVQKALEQLEKRKVAITQLAVSEITGVPPSNFEYYPRVKALLDQKINYISYQDQRRQQAENEMLAKVRKAIQDLEERNQPITATSEVDPVVKTRHQAKIRATLLLAVLLLSCL
jgi:transcriptional regulator with XRE-family HTH domain